MNHKLTIITAALALLRWPLVAALLFSLAPVHAQVMSLQQCIDSALVHEHRIKIADTDERIADERLREARGGMIPKLRAGADYKYYVDLPYQLMPATVFGGPSDVYRAIQFGTPQNVTANLALQVPLYDPTAIGAIRVNKEAAAMAGIQGERTREDVVLEVSAVYYNAQIIQSRLAFVDSNLVNAEELVRSLSLLHEQALARGTDVDRMKLQRDQLKTQREQVRSQREQVLDVLRIFMGMPTDAPVAVAPVEPVTVEPVAGSGTTTAMRLADQALHLRSAKLSLMKQARYPSLSGQGFYGTTGFGPVGADDQFDFYPMSFLGLQLQVPLFQGTIVQHRIKAERYELEKAEEQRAALQDREGMERRTAERQFTVAQGTVVNAVAQLELAGRIRSNTVALHQQGLAAVSDLVMVDQSHRQAQQNYLDALVDLRKAQLELERLNGGLLK
ncbi:MAG: TolC family protein [Flavobacteriales bacterium]|nr:MAG: TolC family protein [Flavobacteriales bacterium]